MDLAQKLVKHVRSVRVAGVLLALVVVTSAALARQGLGPAEEAEPIVLEAVVGIVRPSEVSTITTPVGITVAELMVAVGDELDAGQPIARLDLTLAERDLAQLDLDVERARQDVVKRERDMEWVEREVQRPEADAASATAELALAEREAQEVPMRQAKDSPERAQVAYDQALLRAGRVQQLAENGLIAQQDVADAQFAVRVAADDLENARKAADAARRVHAAERVQTVARRELSLAAQRRRLADQRADLDQARLALKQAQLRYDTGRLAVADAFVRAPRPGAIVELPVHAGDRLTSGTLVAMIASLDPIAIDIDVPASLVPMLRAGDVARVDVPAIDAVGREASIRSIAPLPGDDGEYSIRLLAPNPARARLLAGQTAYVTLLPSGRRARPR